MDNKKESLKKSLGLTEYPWSSDDDEDDDPQQITSSGNFLRHSINTSPSAAGPSTARRAERLSANTLSSTDEPQPSTSRSLSPSRRSQAKRDADLFWPLLNNPHPSTSSASRSISRSRELAPHGSRLVIFGRGPQDRVKPGDIQRIIAYKRLNRSFNNLRACRPNNPFYTVASGTGDSAGLSRPSRNSLFTPAHSNLQSMPAAAVRTSPSSSRTPGEAVLASSVERLRSWGTPPRSAPAAPAAAAPAAADTTDAPPPAAPPAAAPPADDSDATVAVDNTPNVSAEGVSLDAIVEIGDEPDENQSRNNDNADQSDQSGRHATNEETLAGNNSTEESLQTRGVKRRRDGHDGNSEPTTLKELNQSLLSLLECPVCLEWMEPPLPQCRRGHLVCSRCRARISSCPVCRATFSSMRNRAMEGVAELLHYPCRHGCGRELRLRRRAPHEASCALRRYPCPAPACAERPRAHTHEQLQLHFQCEHPSMVKQGCRHSFSVKLNSEQHEHWFVSALREVFHVRVDVDVRTWGVVVYAAYIGPKCNASRYTYQVAVEGLNNGRQLVYRRAAHSDLESYFLNLSRQDCFHLSFDQALNFLRIKNKHCDQASQVKPLKFTLEIIKSETFQELDDSDS